MRAALFAIAVSVLALLALCEIGMAYPVDWWLYASVCIASAIALIRRQPLHQQKRRLTTCAIIITFAAALFFIPWTSRKPFLHDLARVHVGMTEAEVRQIMKPYMLGTGWPALPFSNPSNAPGTLNIVGSDSKYATGTSSDGQMVINDSLVFRHSNKGAFNSDWGIVSFSHGKVTRIEFSPD